MSVSWDCENHTSITPQKETRYAKPKSPVAQQPPRKLWLVESDYVVFKMKTMDPIAGMPPRVKVAFGKERMKVANMLETEVYIDVGYSNIPSWGHLSHMFKVNIKTSDDSEVQLKLNTTEGEKASQVIGDKCKALLAKQQKKSKKKTTTAQPEHIIVGENGQCSALDLSPDSKKTATFTSNLFYYSRQKTNQERMKFKKEKRATRTCDIIWSRPSPVKVREPKFAQPKISVEERERFRLRNEEDPEEASLNAIRNTQAQVA